MRAPTAVPDRHSVFSLVGQVGVLFGDGPIGIKLGDNPLKASGVCRVYVTEVKAGERVSEFTNKKKTWFSAAN